MEMEWYNSEMDTTWTVEISEKGTVEEVIYERGTRRHIYRKNPLNGKFVLSEKVLQDVFAVAINTHDDPQVSELSKILKGKDAKILESVIRDKIEQCINLLANLKKN